MLSNIISLKNPKSLAAEAFRTLRTNIQFSSFDEEIKTMIATSTQPGEGKSTIIINLAVTMAQSGRKVVLLDCDLRKPSIHKKLGISNSEGITSVLYQEKSVKEAIKFIDVPNLGVITSGPIPPNPAELLGSKKMKAFIKELEGHFDVVLIDAPPVLAVTDAQILANLVQGVIFVTSYGYTEKIAMVRAKELIENVGGKILGVVVNKVPNENKDYYYGKYYYNYK